MRKYELGMGKAISKMSEMSEMSVMSKMFEMFEISEMFEMSEMSEMSKMSKISLYLSLSLYSWPSVLPPLYFPMALILGLFLNEF